MKRSALTIRELRTREGWSQSKLARELGVSQFVVSVHETGKRSLSPENLRRAARLFRARIDPSPGPFPEDGKFRRVDVSLRRTMRARDRAEIIKRAVRVKRMFQALGYDQTMTELQALARERKRLVGEEVL